MGYRQLDRTIVCLHLLCLVLAGPALRAQVTNEGHLVIDAGTLVVCTDLSLQNESNGVVTNQGTLATPANITNAAGATMNGNGTWQLGGNWTNAGTFTAGGSLVLFTGPNASTVNSGGAPFQHLHLNKNNNDLTLASNVTVNGEMRFVADNNNILCADFDFSLGFIGLILGADDNNYFVTNGAGMLKRLNLGATAFSFPVGADTNTYNPITVAENGTSDDIGVRCLPQPLTNGNSGPPLTENAVDAAWELTEATAGGASLQVTTQWSASDELSNFVRTDCGIARFAGGADWDLPPANMAAAAGPGPYTRERSGLSPGVLAVLDEAFLNRVLVSPRVVLQGPFNTLTGSMNDNLRSLAGFPLSAPAEYGAGKFVHSGWQPAAGYTIDPAVLAVTGDNAVIDWVFVWLKDPANPATNLQTRVALLQKDGDVVDLNGSAPLAIPANAGNYILGIGHRNHLSIRSPNGAGLALNESAPLAYDFTTGPGQAFGTDPMALVQSTPVVIYALWGGNTNGNNSVRATGPVSINDYSYILNTLGTPTTILTGVYSGADVNLDGTVRATGPPSINDYSKLLSILGTPTTIINEQF